ncbi:MAG: ferritin [Epulopiscium sp.]|nr:ferritin [Candidatus Epulonipiscium sp.]
MLSEKLLTTLNEQIKHELYSSHLYLSMAAYCASQDLDGFTNFFIMQAEEEKFHAMKIFHFLNDKGADIKFYQLDDPSAEYQSVLDVFEASLAHEKFVTKKIYNLMDIATQEKEYSTITFLHWFVNEQVEEEAMFTDLIQKIKGASHDPSLMFLLDRELALRTFTPPAPAAE